MAGVAVVAALSLWGALAGGNGRFPAAQFVAVSADAEGRRIALRTTFGILVSRDGGTTWRWLCEELFEYGAAGPPWDPRLAWAQGPEGTALLVGLADGLVRSTDLCSARRVPEAFRDFSGDVTVAPDGAVLWVSSNGAGPNRVLASRDGGATFETRGTLPEGFLPETLEATGRDGERVYVAGVTVEPRRPAFYRSDDGGRSFRALAFEAQGVRDAFVSGTVPTRPDLVFMRSSLPKDIDGGAGGTVLLRSLDGGQSFHEVARTVGPMHGFALSDDGMQVWIGGTDPRDGLRRSDDGGDTFARVSELEVLCLRWHPSGLYACAPHGTAPFALGRSRDGGRTFAPLVRFEALPGPPPCAPDTPAARLCGPRWPTLRAMFAPPDAGGDGAIRPGDAFPMAPTPSGDCGCRVERPPAVSFPMGLGWWVLRCWVLGWFSWGRRASARGNT